MFSFSICFSVDLAYLLFETSALNPIMWVSHESASPREPSFLVLQRRAGAEVQRRGWTAAGGFHTQSWVQGGPGLLYHLWDA